MYFQPTTVDGISICVLCNNLPLYTTSPGLPYILLEVESPEEKSDDGAYQQDAPLNHQRPAPVEDPQKFRRDEAEEQSADPRAGDRQPGSHGAASAEVVLHGHHRRDIHKTIAETCGQQDNRINRQSQT